MTIIIPVFMPPAEIIGFKQIRLWDRMEDCTGMSGMGGVQCGGGQWKRWMKWAIDGMEELWLGNTLSKKSGNVGGNLLKGAL